MNHRSMPSLSSSISSSAVGDINTTSTSSSSSSSSNSNSQPNTPRTSSCSLYQPNILLYQSSFYNKPVMRSNTFTTMKSANNSHHIMNNNNNKRYSEPPLCSSLQQQQQPQQQRLNTKRWDDSQLEMELAEDDLIHDKNKVRTNSSLRRFNKQQLLSSAESFIIDKFRHPSSRRQSQEEEEEQENNTIKILVVEKNTNINKKRSKFSFKKVIDWLF